MELEHLVALLGLAFRMPYVPDDSAHCETDILYISMNKNAFNFSTVTTPAAGESILPILCCINFLHFATDVAAAKKAAEATGSKLVGKKGLFAPASPAMSRKKPTSTATRKYSLRATETGTHLLTFIIIKINPTILLHSSHLWWEEAPAQSSRRSL